MAEQVARPKIILDDREVQSKLDSLKTKSEELKKKLHYAISFDADFSVVNSIKKQLGGVNSEMQQLKKQSLDVNRVLSNLSGSSLDELVKAKQKLEATLRKTSRDSQEWDVLNEKVKGVKVEIQKLNSEMAVQATAKKGFLSRANSFMNEWGMMAAGAIASFTGLTLAVSKYSDKVRELEDRKLNLQSMTGLSGDEAVYFEQQANKLSTSQTPEGIRITSETQDIIDAYTLMGSKRPELLKSKEDLAAVTREALILSAASKDSAQAATEAVAMAMNQFGATADEAQRYVNVLAAGSQAGAVAVPMITEALGKMGPAAKNVGMNIEQTVAMIETLGEKGIEGAEAGTQLKGVLLTLATGADETNPKIVGMQKAFENLAAKNMSATQMVKLFGKENYATASIMIESVPKLKEYERAVTGTSTAYEQAKTNTSGTKATLAQARNEFTLNAMALAQKLEPAIRAVTVSGSSLLKVLMNLPEILRVMAPTVVALTAAWIAYEVAQGKVNLAARASILWNNKLTDSMRSTFASLAKNPYAAIIAGTGILVSALMASVRYLNAHTYAVNSTASATEGFTTKLSQAKTEAISEFTALSRTTEGTNARRTAIQQLNEKYGQYLSHMLTEKSTLEDIRKAQDEVIRGLTKRIFLQSKEEEISKAGEQFLNRTKDTSAYLLDQVKLLAQNNGALYAETLYNTILDEINLNPNRSIGGIFQKLIRKYPELKTQGPNVLTVKDADGGTDTRLNDSPQWNIYRQAAQILADQKEYKKVIDQIGKQFDGIAKSMNISMEDAASPGKEGATASESNLQKAGGGSADDQAFSREKDALERWFREKQNLYKQQYLQEKTDRSRFDADMYSLELTRLMKLKAIEKRYGKDISDTEGQYLDRRIAFRDKANDMAINAQKEADSSLAEIAKEGYDGLERLLEEHHKDMQRRIDHNYSEIEKNEEYERNEREEKAKSDFEAKRQQFQQFKQLSDDFSQAFGSLMADFINDQEMTQADFANALLLIGLDTLHNVVRMAIAQIWAQAMVSPESIETFGVAGIAKATGMSMIVETAFAVAKSLVRRPTAQREQGKYDVLATDGQTYSAQVDPNPTTGIYGTPTLFAEKGDELIVDGRTLRQIQLRSPWIIDQIMQHRVPQRAEGKYDVATNRPIGAEGMNELLQLVAAQKSVIEKLNDRLSAPIEAKLLSSNARSVLEREDLIRGRARRR